MYVKLFEKNISSGLPVYYWKSKEEAEVDFLIENDYDGVIPIEAKSSENTQSKSLKTYYNLYKPKYYYIKYEGFWI